MTFFPSVISLLQPPPPLSLICCILLLPVTLSLLHGKDSVHLAPLHPGHLSHLENVLIQTMPEDHTSCETIKRGKRTINDDDSARMKGSNYTILTPHKSEFILSKISNNKSTPRKSSSKLNFKSVRSENKENDDNAIAMNTSLCLSSPSSSSSSRQSSTKSSPDSGASVSSYRARL